MRSLAERMRSFEQQKARLADREAKLKLAEKKARNRRLIEMGSLVEKAGLSDLGQEALFGALLFLGEGVRNATQVKQWTNIGAEALAQKTEPVDSEPMVLTFPTSVSKETIAHLRANGFRFNKVLKHWEGIVNFEAAEKIATNHGGNLTRISYPKEKHDAL